MNTLKRYREISVLSKPCAGKERAKKQFHDTAARALARLASALDLSEGAYTIKDQPGERGTVGDVALECSAFRVRVSQTCRGPNAGVSVVPQPRDGLCKKITCTSYRTLVETQEMVRFIGQVTHT